ncbi:AsmA-like C-terminal region-containing protein [Halomonas alkaliantarctica]|uniref:AsmA-like C-terminal region-containing protein n=1 Tax=Halomonas alkaliantarctica TaxID=232346 RepID=A0ABY8LU11_9GAMM|nr:AsmA-like C-terminal region-containing protein [Halomonas alkaliantarctica]WGI26823.1 AsmA-like C-terminal region-containing protein [Halomonas alkaliantarctica]
MLIRSLARWSLLIAAWLLGSTAVLLLLLRLAISQSDALTPRIEALLEARIGVPVTIERLSLSLARNDLLLRLDGVNAETPDGQALFSLEHAGLRLDTWASLANMAPIFSDARISGIQFHLYQGSGVSLEWPEPAELPLLIAAEPDVDLATIDSWAGLILRQRVWVDDTRVVLHGKHDTVMLHAQTLLLTGDERRTRLEGAINIAETLEQARDIALPAAEIKVEMQPGRRGFSDFSAALQLDIQLDQLVALADMFRPDHAAYLEQAGGSARLWGRWSSGRLEEARVAVDVPQLTLRHQVQYAVLRDIKANGLWQRDGEGGEAWLSGDAESVEWAQPPGGSVGPALPRYWHATHQPGLWEVRTSAFELASLTAWRDYVLLPESVTRVLQTLAPRGQVEGLHIGQQDGRWGVDAALSGVEVSPWQQAPGGGPLDAWVQARDFRGRVLFSSSGDSTLYFPEFFAAPMQLRRAEGEVEWVYDGPNTMVSGKNLSVDWDGAQIAGDFGLVTGNQRGHFGLDINFSDVDALERPLAQWLPLSVMDDELQEWLLNDIGGYVSKGSLQLSQPLGERATAKDFTATLALAVTQGHLPIAPGWPRIDDVEGRLKWQNRVLEAEIDNAQSHGITASEGEVVMEDETLNLSGQLQADGPALVSFLQAMPEIDLTQLNDLRVTGKVDGDIALSLPLENPETLQLEINARPRFSEVVYQPLDLRLQSVEGNLAWLQDGESSGLVGEAGGQLLGGPINADIDTQSDDIQLQGRVATSALFGLAGLDNSQGRMPLEGPLEWQGSVALTPTPTLRMESRLVGVTSHLPEPFAKSPQQAWPWTLTAYLDAKRVETQLADIAAARLQLRNGALAGTLNVGRQADRLPGWPSQPGFRLDATVPRIDPLAWQQAIAPLMTSGASTGASSGAQQPLTLSLSTPCVVYQGECLGSLNASGGMNAGLVDVGLSGNLVTGRLAYDAQSLQPLDVTIEALALDRLLALANVEHDSDAPMPDSWMESVETQRQEPVAIPDWLADVPNGRLRLAEIAMGSRRFGPLTAYWKTDGERFSLTPVGLTLGQISARGELYWEGDAVSSHTRADVTIQGGDIGTALERLDQPVAMRSRSTDVVASLDWPGAPWQLELSRSDGYISTDIRDGSFVTLDSAPARLIGLLNFDNILRRLRLDFSDVTGQGTAFDRVQGTADVTSGLLRLRGPLQIDAPAATLAFTGSVDLVTRELDQRLGVTLPVTQSLPIAAIAVGAPIVGGALFLADQLFGDALDRATTLHYRVRGPWTSPQVTLEGPQ